MCHWAIHVQGRCMISPENEHLHCFLGVCQILWRYSCLISGSLTLVSRGLTLKEACWWLYFIHVRLYFIISPPVFGACLTQPFPLVPGGVAPKRSQHDPWVETYYLLVYNRVAGLIYTQFGKKLWGHCTTAANFFFERSGASSFWHSPKSGGPSICPHASIFSIVGNPAVHAFSLVVALPETRSLSVRCSHADSFKDRFDWFSPKMNFHQWTCLWNYYYRVI